MHALQVLEAVADAVAQLVLFSVEAEENNSILPNIVPGAQGTGDLRAERVEGESIFKLMHRMTYIQLSKAQ